MTDSLGCLFTPEEEHRNFILTHLFHVVQCALTLSWPQKGNSVMALTQGLDVRKLSPVTSVEVGGSSVAQVDIC